MKKFEYIAIRAKIGSKTEKEMLSNMGEEGWELISIVHHPSFASLYVVYYFKQEKQ